VKAREAEAEALGKVYMASNVTFGNINPIEKMVVSLPRLAFMDYANPHDWTAWAKRAQPRLTRTRKRVA
jgi:hypothetical protein